MITLTPNDARVLGVLVEKAQTTPQQYPMTLNAITNGCNQKNNREPVTNLSDDQVQEALDSLRSKGLAREVMLSGSRVEKFRHVARETLDIDTNQLVILTELLLRGPQTVGELRGRASRMHPLETTETVKNVLDSLINRAEPYVLELPPAPGDRAARYAQLLCANLHPLDAPQTSSRAMISGGGATLVEPHGRDSELAQRVQRLESEVAQLKDAMMRIAQSLGEPDVISRAD